MVNAVQARPPLIIRIDHMPWGLLDIRVGEHFILCAGIIDPSGARGKVHRAELPPLGRILDSSLESRFLLFIAHGKPVLDQKNPGPDEHALKLGTRSEKLHIFRLRAETHDALDAGAVIPAAVEQYHLAGSGKTRDIALEIPLGFFAFRGCAEGFDPAVPGIEALRDSFDHAALARSIASFEDDYHLQSLMLDPFLKLHQLDLQTRQFLFVELLLDLFLGHNDPPIDATITYKHKIHEKLKRIFRGFRVFRKVF
jgi:hypothetical protein